ncbi:RNA methyltransferase PUA domain-containing protein, partial [Mycolicibacterium elephantis]|uniref:RNA methyltransferase PUA domain-containing protein n=1 Tax=Mycolicibacterium elephantis TaxID=81858 RepID=UPI003A8863D5
MTDALFYVEALPEPGGLAVVDGDEGFHAANVRRIRAGERLDLGDGAGEMAHCVVEETGKARLTARVLDRRSVAPASPTVTVVQAVILSPNRAISSRNGRLSRVRPAYTIDQSTPRRSARPSIGR